MYHVSTLLPYSPKDPQQVPAALPTTISPSFPLILCEIVRARTVQNDVVMIIFRDPSDNLTPYDPTTMPTTVTRTTIIFLHLRSYFYSSAYMPRPYLCLCRHLLSHLSHPLRCIYYCNSDEGERDPSLPVNLTLPSLLSRIPTSCRLHLQRMNVVSRSDVQKFRPELPLPPLFRPGPEFRTFLLTKRIAQPFRCLHLQLCLSSRFRSHQRADRRTEERSSPHVHEAARRYAYEDAEQSYTRARSSCSGRGDSRKGGPELVPSSRCRNIILCCIIFLFVVFRVRMNHAKLKKKLNRSWISCGLDSWANS